MSENVNIDLSQFVKICPLADLKQKKKVRTKLMGKPILVFFDANGDVVAMEMSCKHQGADLSGVTPVDNIITCPRHFWKFNLETGECTSNPNVPSLRKHDVQIVDAHVHISLIPTSFRPIPDHR